MPLLPSRPDRRFARGPSDTDLRGETRWRDRTRYGEWRAGCGVVSPSLPSAHDGPGIQDIPVALGLSLCPTVLGSLVGCLGDVPCACQPTQAARR